MMEHFSHQGYPCSRYVLGQDPISNLQITLERRLVTLYLPTINGPFGEESNQRGKTQS